MQPQPQMAPQTPQQQQMQTVHQQHQLILQNAQQQQKAYGLGGEPIWAGDISWMISGANGQPPRECACSISMYVGKKLEQSLEEE
ncbi:hypothetical protein BGZ93_001485 [Podila epicladia]|nr:hypothetical protein BGZ93_001485 [Podila epicladia]